MNFRIFIMFDLSAMIPLNPWNTGKLTQMAWLRSMLMLQFWKPRPMVIRDSSGTVKVAMVQSLSYCASVVAMEAQVIIQSIHLGFSTGFSSFVLESDSQFIRHKVHTYKPDLFLVGDFVQVIWDSLSSVDNLVTLTYANHSLPHMSSAFFAHRIWLNNFPYQLYHLVVYDILI